MSIFGIAVSSRVRRATLAMLVVAAGCSGAGRSGTAAPAAPSYPPFSDADKRAGVGEGACYHDTDNKNSGSGAGSLNGVGSYENEFRMAESPDISYVKLRHAGVAIDDSPYDKVAPDSNALYLGWIAPGEWVRYTVNVTRAGWYSIATTYTSKFGGHVSLDVNGKDATGPLTVPSTFAQADTVEWRQAHHWNHVAGLGPIYLPTGKQLLTLHFIDQPVMNFDYMEFVPVR